MCIIILSHARISHRQHIALLIFFVIVIAIQPDVLFIAATSNIVNDTDYIPTSIIFTKTLLLNVSNIFLKYEFYFELSGL